MYRCANETGYYHQSIDNINDFKRSNAAASCIKSSPERSEDSHLSDVLHIYFTIVDFVSLVATVRVAREGDEKYLSSQYALLMILV